MRILVISSTPWNNSNCFGLSYSNIFHGIPNLEFANVYCSSGSPENEFNMVAYQVTTESLIKNLKNPKNASGLIVENNSKKGITRTKVEQCRFDKARVLRWQLLFWGRDLVWASGRWNIAPFRGFLDDFQPDIIFQPIYFSGYINDIVAFVKEYTGVPMIGYISDDCYTLRQMRFSPLYWIDRLWKRRKVKNTINQCELLYVISEIQKREYEKIFLPPCKILTKCADFSLPIPPGKPLEEKLQLVYAGNLGVGRLHSLILLADVVKRLNDDGYSIELNVYTSTPMTMRMKQAINDGNGCNIHPPVPYSEIIHIQKHADILIHVEGLSLEARFAVHQSFSTKLVDYFEMGKCIFAIGSENVASIAHLSKYNAAVVAHNKQEAYDKLKNLLQNPNKIYEYGQNAYQCGVACHDRSPIQSMLIKDLQRVSGKTI